jgi:hypothetical protein
VKKRIRTHQRPVLILAVLAGIALFGAATRAAEPNKWLGGAEGAPRAWSEPANWSTGQVPDSGHEGDVVIPGGQAHYPLIEEESDASVGQSLYVKNGGSLEMATGARLTVYADYVDTVDGPDIAGGRRPRGLVVEKGGRLLTNGGARIAARAGGVVLTGKITGRPDLLMESVFHSLVLRGSGVVINDLTLAESPFPYQVRLKGDIRVSGDLILRGSELRVMAKSTVSVGGDVLYPGEGPAALTPHGTVKVMGTVKSDGGATYRRGSDGWVSLEGKGPRRITTGGVLPPLRLAVDGRVSLKGNLHSAGLLVDQHAILQLSAGQQLSFGAPQREWIRDPQSKIVIKDARPRIPTRGSKDLHVRGSIRGIDWVPVRFYVQDGSDIYRVTADYAPGGPEAEAPPGGKAAATASRTVSINRPGSRLKLQGGKLTLDGDTVEFGKKARDELALDAALEGGVEEQEQKAALGNFGLTKLQTDTGPPERMVNVAPAARRISAWPSIGQPVYKVADEDVKTAAGFRGGVTKSGVYRLDFAAPVEVGCLRFRQGRLWALGYVVYADCEGDGRFETVLAYGANGAPRSWQQLVFTPVKLKSVKLRALGVQAGWERSAPTLHELQVFATPETATHLERPARPEVPTDGPPPATFGETVDVPWSGPPEGEDIQNCITVDLWMFGIPTSQDALPPEHLRDNERFQQTLHDIKDMGARGVLLFLEATDKAFWPSTNFESFTNESYFEKLREAARPQPGASLEADTPAVEENLLEDMGEEDEEKVETGNGQQEPSRPVPQSVEELPNQRDLLQEFVDVMHENDLKVYVIARGEIFFPCYIGPEDQDAYMAFVKEVARRGVDGVSVTSDERNFGRSYPTGKGLPENHPAREEFRARWGEDAELPGSIWGKSVDYKRWTVSSYEKIGRRLRSYDRAMKEINPDCESFCVIGSSAVSNNNRMTYGLAYDVLGHIADLDYFGTDYQNKETRRFAAADPDRRACMEGWVPKSVLPGVQSALLGARHVSYYRYNYINMHDTRAYRVREFAFMRALEKWGVTGADLSNSIALVVSRASEDWWDNNHGTCWLGWNPEGKRGFWTARAMTDFLNRNNYQYDLYYLDQPQDLDALTRYHLVFLPFPYSVKERAVGKVEAAHAAGSRILIAQRMGEVDEVGREYDEPRLADLVRRGKSDGTVRYLDRDFIAWEHDRDFDEELGAVLDDLLGDRKPVEVRTYGRRVEAYVFDHRGQSRSVVFLNWADQSATADVALQLGAGQYRAFGLSSDEPDSARTVMFGGSGKVAGNPARFRLDLKAGEALLLRFIR